MVMSEYKVNTLRELLYESEAKHKQRNAFLLKDTGGAIFSLTYEQFKNDAEALGTALISLCRGKGKNIAVFSANSYEWCTCFFSFRNLRISSSTGFGKLH